MGIGGDFSVVAADYQIKIITEFTTYTVYLLGTKFSSPYCIGFLVKMFHCPYYANIVFNAFGFICSVLPTVHACIAITL